MQTTSRPRIIRKLTAALTGAAITLTAATSCNAETSVKVNEVLRSLLFTPQYVALKINAFKDEGIDLVGPKTTWGAQASLTEAVSGNSDIVLMGPEAAILTRAADKSRRFVNFAQLVQADGSFILSKKEISDFQVSNLKGKTIVTSGKGSTPALALLYLVKQAGLDPEKDLTIRFISQSASIIPSYLESNTDFAQTMEPAIHRAVSDNKGYRIASVGKILGEMPYTTYLASEEFISKNPKVIQGFTNAVQKGLNWTHAHPSKEIAALIADYFKGLPEDVLTAVIDEYKRIEIWPKSVVIREEGMQSIGKLLINGGVVEKMPAFEDLVKTEFARNAEAAGK